MCRTLKWKNTFINLLIVVRQLSINFIRDKFDTFCSIIQQKLDILLVSGSKIHDTFPVAQCSIEGYFTLYRIDRTRKGGDILLYVRNNIPSKQIHENLFKINLLNDFLLKLIWAKEVTSLLAS